MSPLAKVIRCRAAGHSAYLDGVERRLMTDQRLGEIIKGVALLYMGTLVAVAFGGMWLGFWDVWTTGNIFLTGVGIPIVGGAVLAGISCLLP